MDDFLGDFEPDISWDEFLYDFSAKLESGEEPIGIPFHVVWEFDGLRPRVLATRRGVGEPSGRPDQLVLNVTYQLTRRRLQEIVLEQIADLRRAGESQLPGLAFLARVDRTCFIDRASAYFVEQLADARQLSDDEGLVMFIADLHERDAMLIADVARQVTLVDRAAGTRFVEQLIELVQESRCRDEIGWLAVEQLIGELESL